MFRIIPEYQRAVRFSLGRYDGTPRGPGWVWAIPIYHRIVRVDLREEVFDVEPQTCITKDNAPVSIDMLVYLRVVKPDDAVLQVQDYIQAARGIAITTLRAVVGDMTLDDVLSRRDDINQMMQAKLDEVTDRWGVKVNAVEIREIMPPRDIQEAMSRQMSAERNRRAAVLEADGQREAAVKVAEGQKQAAILQAEGEREAAVLRAEGQRQARILEAEGYATALERVHQVARGVDTNTMSIQYLDMMKAMAAGPSTKWVVPLELTQFLRAFGGGTAAQAGRGEP